MGEAVRKLSPLDAPPLRPARRSPPTYAAVLKARPLQRRELVHLRWFRAQACALLITAAAVAGPIAIYWAGLHR